MIDSFLKPFALPDSLHAKILGDFDTWHYPYVNNAGEDEKCDDNPHSSSGSSMTPKPH